MRFRAEGRRSVTTVGAYHLALSRQHGASTAATVAMMAGGALQGELRGEKFVLRYEILAATAQTLVSIAACAEANTMIVAATTGGAFSVEAFELKADATHDKIAGCKMHVASIRSTQAWDARAVGSLQPGEVLADARTIYAACDLQEVEHGTGQETYNFFLADLDSAGAPTWIAKAAPTAAAPAGAARKSFSMYLFGLDRGPDNQKATKLVGDAISPFAWLAWAVGWCLFHRLDAIVLAVIKVLDTWSWRPACSAAEAPGYTFFSGVSTLSNVWRSPGQHKVINQIAQKRFRVQECKAVEKIVGKCLRGRWGSLFAVVCTLLHAVVLLRVIFVEMWGSLGSKMEEVAANSADAPDPAGSVGTPGTAESAASGARDKAGPAATPSRKRKPQPVPSNEDVDAIRTKARNARRRAVQLIGCDLFVAMMIVARVALRPLMRLLFWAQGEVRSHNEKERVASESQKSYVGETPLSKYVCGGRHEETKQQILELLEDSALEDDDRWGAIWHYVPNHLWSRAAQLISRVGVVTLSHYELRFTAYVESLHVQILFFVEKPRDVVDPDRIRVARRLLAASRDELITKEGDTPPQDSPQLSRPSGGCCSWMRLL